MKFLPRILKKIIITPPCFSKVKKSLFETPTVDEKSNLWEVTTVKYRIVLIMLWIYTEFFENLKMIFSYAIIDNTYYSLTKKEKSSFTLLYRRLMGNVVTFSYDEGIDTQDISEFGLDDMKQNIIRLFIAILYGYDSSLFNKSSNYRDNVIIFIHDLKLDKEVEEFIFKIVLSMKIEISDEKDFFYDSSYKNANLLNIPIVGALEFGRDLNDLVKELSKLGLQNHAYITVERVLKNLLLGGHGQIHSVLQKDINIMTWKKYIDLSYKKGNDLVRLDHALYGMLDDNVFTQTSCDFVAKQIFCDDVCDVLEDTLDGTLTAVALFYLAQGELAKKLKPYYINKSFIDIEYCKKMIIESGLIQSTHEGVLMYYHPYGEIPKFDNINNSEELEYLVKVIFVNSEDEFTVALLYLLDKYIVNISKFILLWDSKEYKKCYEYLQRQKVNDRFLKGWKIYIYKIKNKIIEETSYSPLDEKYRTSYYYKTMLGWYYRAKYISPLWDKISLLFYRLFR